MSENINFSFYLPYFDSSYLLVIISLIISKYASGLFRVTKFMDSFVKGQHVDLQFLIKVHMKEYLLAVSISKSISPGFLAWNQELNRFQ